MKQFFALLAILGLITTSVSSQKPNGNRNLPPGGERNHERGRPHRQGPPDPFLMLFDTDRDSQLSQQEMEQATTILKNRDNDQNGVLTPDELPHPPPLRSGSPPHRGGENSRHHQRGDYPPPPRGAHPPQQRREHPPQRRSEGPRHYQRGDYPPPPRGAHPPQQRGEHPPQRRSEGPRYHQRGDCPPPPRGAHPPQQRGDRPHSPVGDRPPKERRKNPKEDPEPQAKNTNDVPNGSLIFTEGYVTDPRDHGRPVTLIAAALGVKPDVFRQAFSNVKPARGGDPTPSRAQANKKILMDALGKHGITNDRLDTVSNYYRYRPGRGNLWKHTPASAKAIIKDGKITGFKITNPGSGYTTPPSISIAGHPAVQVKATLEFSKNLQSNGSIKALTIVK